MKTIQFVSLVCCTSFIFTQGNANDQAHIKNLRDRSRLLEPPEEKETEGAIESDMLLTAEQQAERQDRIIEQQTGIKKRKAISNLSNHWPNATIPYVVASQLGDDFEVLKEAMDMWMERTCIKYVAYDSDVAARLGHNNYIEFIEGDGCSSYVGMLGSGSQAVSIGKDCRYAGTVAHELGHAMGFHHEQSRPDRDDYVTIAYENIAPNKEHNFAKYSLDQVDSLNVPYDAGSIMHYGPYYFSENGEPTIISHDPLGQVQMGNRDSFSFYDAKLANLLYKCSADCDSDVQCQNEGYRSEDCTCVCQQGYSGPSCEVYAESDAGCFKVLSDSAGTLTSPGYPELYKNNQLCAWNIIAPEGSMITLHFSSFSMDVVSYTGVCFWDELIIRPGPNLYEGGNSHCGQILPEAVTSVGNEMLIIFITDAEYPDTGFVAHYEITMPSTTPKPIPSTTPEPPIETCEDVVGTCGGTFEGSGCIASTNYGSGPYDNGKECVYKIKVPKNQHVAVNITDLHIEGHDTCSWDRLEVYISNDVIGYIKLCGDVAPVGFFVSLTNTMKLKMVSDSSVGLAGFAASYKPITIK